MLTLEPVAIDASLAVGDRFTESFSRLISADGPGELFSVTIGGMASLDSAHATRIFNALVSSKNVMHLSISNSSFDDRAAAALGKLIESNTNLDALSLDHSLMSDETGVDRR